MLCAEAMKPQCVSDQIVSGYCGHQAAVGVTDKHTEEHELARGAHEERSRRAKLARMCTSIKKIF